MVDEPENLVLVYLRRFDQQLGEMRSDIRNLALRVGAVEHRFSALEARFASLEEQMIGANQRLDRINGDWIWWTLRPEAFSSRACPPDRRNRRRSRQNRARL